MLADHARLGLRLSVNGCSASALSPTKATSISTFTAALSCSSICRRYLSLRVLVSQTPSRPSISRKPLTAATPPPTNTPSSFFTPSLCRHRNASTYTPTSDPTPPTPAGRFNPPASSVVLDWNTFFRLRTSRRRYSLTSSVLGSVTSSLGFATAFQAYPDLGETITKWIPTDPIISVGVAFFAALFAGWLIGPVFGNGLWKLLQRSKMPEFTIKERAFFERIKKHRVNPSGASTNNPVPDYYGEKIGSVQGYRRWLKDQRAFNRKRGGNYPTTV